VRGWYRGLAPTLVGYLPTWAIYFVAYERFKVGYRQFLGMLNDHAAVGAARASVHPPQWPPIARRGRARRARFKRLDGKHAWRCVGRCGELGVHQPAVGDQDAYHGMPGRRTWLARIPALHNALPLAG